MPNQQFWLALLSIYCCQQVQGNRDVMSVSDLSLEKLKELATFLDKFSPSFGGEEADDSVEYWRLLIQELGKLPNKGQRFLYRSVEIEDFASEALKNHSPSLMLLYHLREKKLKVDELVSCLENIECTGALNVFKAATTPVVILQPTALTLKTREQIILVCEAECYPPAPEYFWFHCRGQDLIPIPGSNSSRLIISNANGTHSGLYACRVRNPHVNDEKKAYSFSEWVRVEVAAPEHVMVHSPIRQETQGQLNVARPMIVSDPVPSKVYMGERAALECQAEGEGLVYDWYKNSRIFKQDQKQGRLVFEHAREKDGGEYYCMVVNNGGRTESAHVRLTVEPVIVIKKHPTDCRGRVNDEITLRCEAYSSQGKQLVYQWYQQRLGDRSKEIGAKPELRVRLNFTPRVEYKIFCKVSLAEDSEVAVYSKTVTVTLDTIWIVRQPLSINRYIGEKANLFCRAEGVDGNISYLWLKSTTKEGRKEPLRDGSSRIFTFNGLTQKDWGYYTCQADNDYQHVSSDTVHVSMEPRPPGEREREAPVIRLTKQPWSQVIALGGRFRLICKAVATADEPLHYQWHVGGYELRGETSDQLIRENVSEDVYGSYHCVVVTDTGLASAVSDTARIERAPSRGQSQDERMSGTQLQQQQAERKMMTATQERYALEKVALLIGNRKYEHAEIGELTNPENDVLELGKVLREMKFKVFSLVNLRFGEMMTALEIFYEMLTVPEGGVYALFYYSGHGFSYNKSQYLIPVDATYPLQCDYNIAADKIGTSMQGKLSKVFKILDCCRSGKEDEVIPPKENLLSSLGYANMVELTSCPVSHPSYESQAESNSTFNTALVGALKQGSAKIGEIVQRVMDGMQNISMNGSPFMRPTAYLSLTDSDISLHDDIMLDNPEQQEEKLDNIYHKWELAHSVPESVRIADSKLGELSDQVSVELRFDAEFSNVLLVTINLHLLVGGCTASVDFDREFLENQGPNGEFVQPEFTNGATSNGATDSPSTLRICNMQRLQDQLKLCLYVTVRGTSREKTVTLCHEFSEKPLFARLLESR